MSHVTTGNETLGSVTLPDVHGHSESMTVNTASQQSPDTSRHHRFALAIVVLVAAALGLNTGALAQDVAPPIPGALGQIQSVSDNSISIQTKSGIVQFEITQPLTTYKVVPSDLTHITDKEYLGVASTELPNGTHVAKQIFIFPTELRGAVEGSFLMDAQPGTAPRSRMTNGTVSQRGAIKTQSRMTNGVVQKGSGTTLVVRYQDGAKTISVPANVTVLAIIPGEIQLATGETAYAKTEKQADGRLTTHMILVIGGSPSGSAK